jgi:hypothetical protein
MLFQSIEIEPASGFAAAREGSAGGFGGDAQAATAHPTPMTNEAFLNAERTLLTSITLSRVT